MQLQGAYQAEAAIHSYKRSHNFPEQDLTRNKLAKQSVNRLMAYIRF